MTLREGILAATAALCGLLPACTPGRYHQTGPQLDPCACNPQPARPAEQALSAPTAAAQPAESAQVAATQPSPTPPAENQTIVQAAGDGSTGQSTVEKITHSLAEDQEVEGTVAARAKKDSKPEEPLLEALRCFLDNRAAEALPLLAKYDQANQDLLLCLLPLAARLTTVNLSQMGEQETAMVIDQLDSGMTPLRARAALVIDKMCFCRRDGIYGFGVYEPLSEDHAFRTGDLVDVYVELRNFLSEKQERAGGQNVYLTRLMCRAEIFDKEGALQKRALAFRRARPDESRTLRHDYFEHCQFYMPDIPPGNYTLRLQVTDLATKRTVQGPPLPFRVTDLAVRRQ